MLSFIKLVLTYWIEPSHLIDLLKHRFISYLLLHVTTKLCIRGLMAQGSCHPLVCSPVTCHHEALICVFWGDIEDSLFMVGILLILECSNLKYILHSEESVVLFSGLQLVASIWGWYMSCVVSCVFHVWSNHGCHLHVIVESLSSEGACVCWW